jgi:hypothetical protein
MITQRYTGAKERIDDRESEILKSPGPLPVSYNQIPQRRGVPAGK